VTDEPPLQHATDRLPIVTDTHGHAYLGADAVVALLRAIEHTHRRTP
jgi:predicted DCC family thiol-disulfide oxidoreductase YuxK